MVNTARRVRGDLNEQLPQVIGDRIQLQVLLNSITNAVDSMAAKDEPRVLCVKSGVHAGGGVKVSVTDTGTGIGSHDIDTNWRYRPLQPFGPTIV